MKKSLWISMLTSLLIAFGFHAQAKDSIIQFDAPTSKLYLEQLYQDLLNLGIDTEADMSAFKVPANRTTSAICIPGIKHGQWNPCAIYEQITTLTCPETLPVTDTATGKIHYVPVECTGPHADGNCDCEIK